MKNLEVESASRMSTSFALSKNPLFKSNVVNSKKKKFNSKPASKPAAPKPSTPKTKVETKSKIADKPKTKSKQFTSSDFAYTPKTPPVDLRGFENQ